MIDSRSVLLVVAIAACTSAFVSWNHVAVPLAPKARPSCRQPFGLRMGGSIMEGLIERKQKEVEALKANPPPGVAERIAKMGSIKNTNAVYKALKKPKGTLTVIPQMKFKTPKLGKFTERPEPDIVGGHYYESGASAVCVCVDEEGYGFTHKDMAIVVKGQNIHKGDFPGPLPCIAYDIIIDPIQIALAAEYGAQGVMLNVATLKNRTKDMVDAANALGLDALVQVHNEDELQIALSSGSKIIGVCNRNQDTFELISPTDYVTREWTVPIEETIFNLGRQIPDGTIRLAMGNVNETLMAWKLRDFGYNSVMIGETLMRGSEMRMASGPYQAAYNEAKGLVKAFRSKGSVKYGPSSTASFYGKGEGAKETLGEIQM